jgi:hypothetical protein
MEESMKILSKYKALPEHLDDYRLFDEFTQLEEVVCMRVLGIMKKQV